MFAEATLSAVCRLLLVLASLVAEPGLHGVWDLPRPGVEPMPSALAGGFLTNRTTVHVTDIFVARKKYYNN